MPDRDREAQIRERAHAIWEQQGRPEGRDEEHWHQARHEIDTGQEAAQGLREIVTDTIGLAVGAEPPGAANASGAHSMEPAEGDRDTVARELARPKKAKSPKKGTTPDNASAKIGVSRSRKPGT